MLSRCYATCMSNLKVITLVSLLLIVVLMGCSSSNSAEDNDATATSLALDKELEPVIEELFWITADSSDISRDTPFSEARDMLAQTFWDEASLRSILLEEFGIDAKTTVPFCIPYIGVTATMFKVLETAPPIAESTAVFLDAIDMLVLFDEDIDLALSEGTTGRVDTDLCNQLAEEILLTVK